jgi:hypothetical protein
MNPIPESIPTVFNPETAFAISLQGNDEEINRAHETFDPRRVEPPTDEASTQTGIPWSAIHD